MVGLANTALVLLAWTESMRRVLTENELYTIMHAAEEHQIRMFHEFPSAIHEAPDVEHLVTAFVDAAAAAR